MDVELQFFKHLPRDAPPTVSFWGIIFCVYLIISLNYQVIELLNRSHFVNMTTNLSQTKVILDTDPGGDDVFALLWLQSLVKQGLAELVAVTTADGNVPAKYTFANASKILKLGALEQVEVGRGVSGKKNEIEDAAHIHGADGMGNLSHTLPPTMHKFEEARYSDEILIDKLNAAPGEISILAIGPLTNLASAEEKQPGILKKAKEIVLMGGAFNRRGNITPQAEFNIAYNPEAAQKVFDSRNDIVVLPLDVTHELIFTDEMANHVSQVIPDSDITQFIVSLCKFMTKTALGYRETKGIQGFLVHDAATVAYLFYPETLLLRRAKVSVETQGEWTRGQTLFDNRHSAKIGANSWVATQVDKVNFFASFIEDLKSFFEM